MDQKVRCLELFESFKCYRDLFTDNNEPLTDQQALMLLYKQACYSEIGNYEDEMLETLLGFFTLITGIPFIRLYGNGPRPTDVQYGALTLLEVDPIGEASTKLKKVFPLLDENGDPVLDDNDNPIIDQDCCERVEVKQQAFTYTFQMDVYRDSGQGKNKQPESFTQPIGSAIDVLIKAKLRMCHLVMVSALRDKNIWVSKNSIREIRNIPDMDGTTWESRATSRLSVKACAQSSIRNPAEIFPDDPCDAFKIKEIEVVGEGE